MPKHKSKFVKFIPPAGTPVISDPHILFGGLGPKLTVKKVAKIQIKTLKELLVDLRRYAKDYPPHSREGNVIWDMRTFYQSEIKRIRESASVPF